MRQRIRNLLRDGASAPVSAPARRYLGDLLATVEPVVQPLRTLSPRLSVADRLAVEARHLM
jgi:hypothetical protein